MQLSSAYRYDNGTLDPKSVYESIKALILQQGLPLGKRIHVEPLADALNVSNTPVREALIQLSTERLIRNEPNAGFFTKELSELEIRNMYIFQLTLLDLSLSLVRKKGEVPGMLKPPKLIDKVSSHITNSSNSNVEVLNELFTHISRQSGNIDVIQGIMNINDRTFFVRLHECEAIPEWGGDLENLCELYYHKKIKELRNALQVFQNKTVSFLPDLILLLKRSTSDFY